MTTTTCERRDTVLIHPTDLTVAGERDSERDSEQSVSVDGILEKALVSIVAATTDAQMDDHFRTARRPLVLLSRGVDDERARSGEAADQFRRFQVCKPGRGRVGWINVQPSSRAYPAAQRRSWLPVPNGAGRQFSDGIAPKLRMRRPTTRAWCAIAAAAAALRNLH